MKNKSVSFNIPSSDFVRLLCVTIIVFAAMSYMRPHLFLRPANFITMGFQLPELGLYSLAMMMAFVSGGIDLSIISIGNLAAITTALILRTAVINELVGGSLLALVLLGMAAGLAVGFVCGLINGIVIAFLKIPPMMATMATSLVYTGLAVGITQGRAISRVPPEFLYFGSNRFLGVPLPLWLLIAAFLFTAFLLNRTRFGLEVKLVGSNIQASHYSGINTKLVLIKAYLYSSMMSAICGLLILSRIDSARADHAFTFTFMAILAVMLGATNPNGGSAKVSCMALSLLTLQFLSSGFNMLRLGGQFREFAWGLLLILVMAAGFLFQRYKEKKSVKLMLKQRSVT